MLYLAAFFNPHSLSSILSFTPYLHKFFFFPFVPSIFIFLIPSFPSSSLSLVPLLSRSFHSNSQYLLYVLVFLYIFFFGFFFVPEKQYGKHMSNLLHFRLCSQGATRWLDCLRHILLCDGILLYCISSLLTHQLIIIWDTYKI